MGKGYAPSRREKILALALFVFLAVVGSTYFLFLPAMNTRDDLLADLNEARIAHTQVRSQVSSAADMEAMIGEAWQKLSGHFDILRPFLSTEDLESEFTVFLLQNGLTPNSVMLETDDASTDELLKFNVTVSAEAGSIDDVMSLTEYANGIYSFRLAQMDMSENISESGYSVDYIVEASVRTVSNDFDESRP